ncbi:TPA: hypothetical protein EYP37_08215 [Candidatus Poribacteria bacterium]|nr:hypothetical protein [Candidatus Poribacteria bacterium]
MSFCLTGLMLSLILSSGLEWERVSLENFDNPSDWTPQDGSPTAELSPDGHLILKCRFKEGMERCFWDKEIRLDLSRYGRFSLKLSVENPEAISNGTIYFRSGEGWFGGWFPLRGEEETISLNKGDFRIEGKPTGWDRVDGIRLSFWRRDGGTARVIVKGLEGIVDRIVVVRGNLTILKGSPETRSVRQFAGLMIRLLRESGLEFGVLDDTDVEEGALVGARLAIFPFNPDISDRECRRIKEFIEAGGKIMLFYSLPKPLAEPLGISEFDWTREKYPGQFTSISFSPQIEGMPESILQGSWNVRIPEKFSSARVIGEWVDSKGRRTGIPAMTIGPGGVFMGHVLLAGDLHNKRRMLFALFGELMPEVREELGRRFIKSTSISRLDGISNLLDETMEMIPRSRAERVLKGLEEAKGLLWKGELALESNRYGELLDYACGAGEKLREVYLMTFPSRKGEFRAVWCHSAFGVEGWSWDEAAKWLADHGFTAIMPNMLWGGVAYYPSEVLPVADEVKERGDQIKLCLKAAKKYGLQVHVWKVNWNLGRSPEWFVEKMREEGRLQLDRDGNEIKWLCPSHPENFKLELESMLEVVRKYDVDGIHFDYIRYPHGNACYCKGCKGRFEKAMGIRVERWPQDVIDGPYARQYAEWRREQITRLVREVSRKAREINPKIKISAAVFKDYPRCRDTVGQDWKAWIEAGYLDFVCPMNYTDDDGHFADLVRNQIKIVGGRIPLYPGVGASAPGLEAEQVARQIHLARKLGADGFTIFNYDLRLAEQILPALRKGVTAE